ncbi:bacteriocin-like protein [Chryseobacterium phosphatilyticum]|nr:hypothetical protein [Chryseobacterium phosphatilyticum]
MKNFKKLNRNQQKQIQGGAFRKCSIQNPCSVGWCCNGVCSPMRCIDNDL